MKKALLIILLMAIAPYLKAQKVTHHKAKHPREIKYPSCDTSGQLIDQPCIVRVHYVHFDAQKADTSKLYYVGTTKIEYQGLRFYGIDLITGELLNVSAPDSAGIYTVKFSKSRVKFINDSTFTFKNKR